MGSSIDRTDQLFWLAYCDAIRTKAGFSAQDGTNSAIFFGTDVQRGPPAGDNIDAAYTNAGLFAIADNLLQPDGLFYVPSAQNSYVRSLMTYLGWVDLKGNPSPEQMTKLTSLLQIQNATQTGATAAYAKAKADFTMKSADGFVPTGQTFAQWSIANAPAYTAAQNTYQQAASAYQIEINTVYGAQSLAYQRDLSNVTAAMLPSVPLAGINMTAAALSPDSALAIYKTVVTGGTPAAPTNTYQVAQYTSQQYKPIASDFVGYIGNDQVPVQTLTISMNSGSSVKLTDFNTTSFSGNVGFTYNSWFSVNASASSSSTSSSVLSDSQAQGITVTMTYKSIKSADIAPGAWNIGDPKNTYALKAGAPKEVRTLVRPSRLVLGCGVGWTITVGDDSLDTIDKATATAKSGGGSLSIFGIPISVGGNASESTDTTTHNATWDRSQKTLTVLPTYDAGFASVLAVIGEKIETA